MYDVTYYEDEFCCDELEIVVENEVCDTYGGDYSYRDTYICKKCRKAFNEYHGSRFKGIEEIYDKDEINYYLNYNN